MQISHFHGLLRQVSVSFSSGYLALRFDDFGHFLTQ